MVRVHPMLTECGYLRWSFRKASRGVRVGTMLGPIWGSGRRCRAILGGILSGGLAMFITYMFGRGVVAKGGRSNFGRNTIFGTKFGAQISKIRFMQQ